MMRVAALEQQVHDKQEVIDRTQALLSSESMAKVCWNHFSLRI